MKSILTIVILLSLVVSGSAQTRNVVVGTNGAVVSPTNFWSADVTNARSGLELGSAATNPASAFQPSSATLSNLSVGNGVNLTNITATIVGTNISITNVAGLQSALNGKLATNGNTTGTASNVTGVVALTNGGTGASNAASARTSLGATTVGGNIFTLANPDEIRFLRLNVNSSVSALTASDFRTAIGASATVGTVTSVGMTVPSIISLSVPTITSSGTFALTLANQSSRHAFLAPNGGGIPAFRSVESDDLPALAIAKITGLQTALDGKLATSGTATLATNVTGIVALTNGGTGANSAATARTALGSTTVGSSVFTLNNPSAITFLRFNADNTATALSDSAFRSAIGLGTAATNPATAFQPSSSVLTNLAANNGSSLTNIPVAGVVGALSTSGNGAGLTNLTAANITGTVGLASNVTTTIAITNGGSGATTAGGARTNLGLGTTNNVEFRRVTINLPDASGNSLVVTNALGSAVSLFDDIEAEELDALQGSFGNTVIISSGGISFNTNTAAANTRTNLNLGWSALTNTNTAGFNTSLYGSGTNPVLYSTNGEVVAPTNFWQVAPIVTRFVEFDPATNATTNIVAARNLHIHSLAISRTGVTSTIDLPITNSFNGDIALVVHQGPTSSVTAVRAAGAGTNLITLNQPEQTVEFVFYNSVWQFNHNLSYTEPIFFSGTNAAANAAASRTNLGATTVGNSVFTATNANSAQLVLFGTNRNILDSAGLTGISLSDGETKLLHPISFPFLGGVTVAATTRTNLGLPLPALTNTSNATFQEAVFTTNTAPTNGSNFGDRVGWMGVSMVTNGVTNVFKIPIYK